jgi:hypothetical protein
LERGVLELGDWRVFGRAGWKGVAAGDDMEVRGQRVRICGWLCVVAGGFFYFRGNLVGLFYFGFIFIRIYLIPLVSLISLIP